MRLLLVIVAIFGVMNAAEQDHLPERLFVKTIDGRTLQVSVVYNTDKTISAGYLYGEVAGQLKVKTQQLSILLGAEQIDPAGRITEKDCLSVAHLHALIKPVDKVTESMTGKIGKPDENHGKIYKYSFFTYDPQEKRLTLFMPEFVPHEKIKYFLTAFNKLCESFFKAFIQSSSTR